MGILIPACVIVLGTIILIIVSFFKNDKKKANYIFSTVLLGIIIPILTDVLGLCTFEVRFNPSSSESPYSISSNDTIVLTSDFSFAKIAPIYYTTDGTHVDDATDPIKYTEPISVQNLNTDDQLVIHAAVKILWVYFCDSSYTYNVNGSSISNEQDTYDKTNDNELDSKIHVVIEEKDITLDELKAQNYVVDIVVTLQENAGYTHSYWGAFTRDDCIIKVAYQNGYESYPGDSSYIWLWQESNYKNTHPGKIMTLRLQLPFDIAVGDFIYVNYWDHISSDDASNELSHIWHDGTTDWVANGKVTWDDGGIRIIE